MSSISSSNTGNGGGRRRSKRKKGGGNGDKGDKKEQDKAPAKKRGSRQYKRKNPRRKVSPEDDPDYVWVNEKKRIIQKSDLWKETTASKKKKEYAVNGAFWNTERGEPFWWIRDKKGNHLIVPESELSKGI